MTRVLATASIASVALTAFLASASMAQRDNSVPYQADSLVQHWHLLINQTVEDAKAYTSDEFVDEVNELIDQFLAIGGVRAAQDRATPEQLRKADESVKRFAAAMVEAANRQDDGVKQVTDESVRVAVKKICPQYPFCQ